MGTCECSEINASTQNNSKYGDLYVILQDGTCFVYWFARRLIKLKYENSHTHTHTLLKTYLITDSITVLHCITAQTKYSLFKTSVMY